MANVILKDRNGKGVTYNNITELKIPAADGTNAIFGNSSWVEETIKTSGGEITPTGTEMRISHNLGTIPDYIFIGKLDGEKDYYQDHNYIKWAYGWSRRMIDMKGFSGYGTLCMVLVESDKSNDNEYIEGKYFILKGIEEHADYTYGEIRDTNKYSFLVGLNEKGKSCEGLDPNARYYWCAISGLGVRMNRTDEV